MKAYKYAVTFLFPFFINGSCEHKENQRFIIRNESDKEIIIINSYRSIQEDISCFTQNMTKREYQNFIRYGMVPPRSYKNFERIMWGEYLISAPNDTLYISVFFRKDIDSMPCEEFKQAFPIKHEWKITLEDMQAYDLTLVYTPED